MSQPHITELRPTLELIEMPLSVDRERSLVRRWVGRTDDGIEVDVWVAVVRVADGDAERFEHRFRELLEIPAPASPDFTRPR
ncbi:MAG: hypothetical protein AB7T31_15015 [Gemmatimonadales bacterium]